jgi:Arc/MetJ family transcription regulator
VNFLTSQSIAPSLLTVRTTLDIPEALIEEARRILGFKSKTDTVVLSLQELIRRRRIEELKQIMGEVDLEIDIPASRRRPQRVR